MSPDGTDLVQLCGTATADWIPSWSPTQSTCQGRPVTIGGTSGNEVLQGSPGPDAISGQGGDDRIKGLDGNDLLCGGPGNDTLYGEKETIASTVAAVKTASGEKQAATG